MRQQGNVDGGKGLGYKWGTAQMRLSLALRPHTITHTHTRNVMICDNYKAQSCNCSLCSAPKPNISLAKWQMGVATPLNNHALLTWGGGEGRVVGFAFSSSHKKVCALYECVFYNIILCVGVFFFHF